MHSPKQIKDYKPSEVARRELFDGADKGFVSDWTWDESG